MIKNIYEKKLYSKLVKFSYKDIFLILFAILVIILSFFTTLTTATETSTDLDEIEQELTETVEEQLSGIDLGDFQQILNGLSEQEQSIFGSSSFYDKVSKLLSSDLSSDQSLFQQIFNILLDEILNFIPLLATICAIAILGSFISNLRVKTNDQSIADIVHFVCFGVIIVILSGAVFSLVGMTKNLLSSIQAQMQILFPILLTLLTSLGGLVSVSVFQPLVAVLVSGVMQIFNYVVFPLFICTFIFTIVGNLSNNIKLDKFISFFKSSFKWVTGSIMTLFFTFLTIQGITAGSFDGVSVQTAKYAIKSYIPLVGGYLSDGFNLIMSSSILIKNALGVAGLLLLFATIIIPVIKIVIFGLGLKLASAVIEPLADFRTSNFIFTVSKTMGYLVATILCIAFMYLITVGLIIISGNAFYT